MLRVSAVALTVFATAWLSCSYATDNPTEGEYIRRVIDRRYAGHTAVPNLAFDAVQYRRNVDGDWKVKSEQIWKKRILADRHQNRHETIFSVQEDGKPWDADKMRDEIRKMTEKYEEDSKRRDFKSPIDSSYYMDYSFEIHPATNSNGIGLDSVTFIAMIRDDKHLDGYMLVDTTDYSVMYLEFELADRPTGVKHLWMAYDYVRLDNGYTFPERSTFRGAFGFLFFKARREVVDEYSNFDLSPDFSDTVFNSPYSYGQIEN
jgi:hypothetical protein